MLKVFFGVMSLLFSSTFVGIACSCLPQLEVAEAVEKSDVVLKVKVTEIMFVGRAEGKPDLVYRDKPDFSTIRANEDYYFTQVVKIRVQQKYKGKFYRKLAVVETGLGGGDCGFEFENKGIYLLYGSMLKKGNWIKHSTFSTNICTRTARFKEQEEAVIKAL